VKILQDLVKLKNIIPSNNNTILREDLIKQIENNLNFKTKIILLSAPAGYGKTTLISSWVEDINKNTAWFTIYEEDNEIISFMQGIIDAFRIVDDKLFKSTFDLLQLVNFSGNKSVLAVFFEEIRTIDKNIILVLDNYHLIENNEVNNLLKKLISHLPDNITVVILTREDPQLNLNIYRLEGSIVELRINELKFNVSEIEDFYNNLNIKLNDNDLRELANRTEGWISGLKLAGLKLLNEEENHIHNFINQFTGSNYYIMDYLMEEVLEDVDEELKDFLCKTSIVEKISPDLCNYLLGINDSFKKLKKIMKMNLFIYELDANKHWFRYHQLFKDLLSFHLDDKKKTELHRNASKWFYKNNLYKDAVEEAIKANDNKLAVKYIEGSISEYLEEGKINNLLELINKIPDNEIRDSIPIMIIKAWSLFVIGKKKDALYYIELIGKYDKDIDDNNKGRLYTLTSLIPEINKAKDPTLMAKKSLELIDDKDYIFKINGWMSLGQIQASIGRLDESIKSFKKAYYLSRESQQSFLEIISLINLALKLNQKGKLQEAINFCDDSIERYTYSKHKVETLAKLIYIPKGIFLYQLGDYKIAKELLLQSIEVSEQFNLVHVAWMPKIYYALSLYLNGENNKAKGVINDLIKYTKHYNLIPNLRWAESIKNELDITMGNIKLNDNLEEKIKKQLSLNNDYNYVRYLYNYIRLLLTNNKIDKALELLKENQEVIKNKDFVEIIRYYLFLASAYYYKKDESNTIKHLKKVIELMGSEQYLSVFIRDGELFLPIIDKFKDLNFNLLNKAEKQIKKQIKIDNEDANNELIEPLTERELEILKLVSQGMTNKSIADELYITIGTTKWHLSNIYSKLAVKSRTKATIKAKKFGIIE